MHHMLRRMDHFMQRIRLLQKLTGGTPTSAARILLEIRSQPDAVRTIEHEDKSVAFRGPDLDALFEVLAYQEYGFLRPLLSSLERPIVIDVGAHIGAFAIWAAGINARARVLSIEADPATCAVAQMNARSLSACRFTWQVINRAAGDSDGTTVRISDAGPSMSHRIHPNGNIEVESISLPAVLDLAAPNGEPIDLMKIDIEGAEEDFLSGSQAALRRVNALVVELHPYLCNANNVEMLLKRHFDEVSTMTSRLSSKPVLYCRRGGTT